MNNDNVHQRAAVFSGASRSHRLPEGKFRRSALALCVMAASAQSYGQEGSSIEEEVVVTGIQASLENAQDIKREADTFVDAISASDINSLPDKSVLEAIQRLPGVAIERFAGSDDADHFSVEGSGVIIRGLTQTRSEFNGRDTFSADSGRGLSFQDVPPELMGSVELFKNQSADMIEGAISGTVNLNTRLPFDSDERVVAFTATANYADFVEETTPSFSGLYSTRWENDSGEFGFLFNLAYSQLKSLTDGIQIYNRYDRVEGTATAVEGQPVGSTVWVPHGANIRREEQDRKRLGAGFAFQWESPDDTVLATLQFLRSDATQAWAEHAVQYEDEPTTRTNVQPLVGTNFNYDENGYFTSGTITSAQTNVAEREGRRYSNYARDHDNNTVLNDFGFNIEYTPNDKWAFSADLQYVKASQSKTDITAHAGHNTNTYININGDNTQVSFLGPGGTLSAPVAESAGIADPTQVFFRSAMDHRDESDGKEVAFRFDTEYFIDETFFRSVETGVRFADREQTVRRSDYNWGNLSESWSGGINQLQTAIDNGDADIIETFTFDNFQRGGNLDSRTDTFYFVSMDLVDADNYQRYADVLSSPTYRTSSSAWTPLAQRAGVVAGTPFLPTEIVPTVEKSEAAYVKLNFGRDDTRFRFDGNIGLRYISYDISSTGGVTFPTPDCVTADQGAGGQCENNINAFLDPADVAFANGATQSNTGGSTFDKVLPSFNLKVEFTEDFIGRFGLSEAIALPDLGNLRNHTSIRRDFDFQYQDNDPNQPLAGVAIESYFGQAGNPKLLPMESTQVDLSGEWYFAQEGVGSLTGTLFYKELSNTFRSGSFQRSFTNNGVTRTASLIGPVNAGDGVVKGFELAYQQFYSFLPEPFDGLGVQFTYTYVDESGTDNANLRVGDPRGPVNLDTDSNGNAIEQFADLPLEGLSKDTVNLVLMFEKGPVSTRLAYNYRSDYLLSSQDVISFVPNFHEATDQLDASFFYSITDNIKIGLEANNLLNEVNHLKMKNQSQEDVLSDRSWFVNDRRFALTLRASF